MLVGDVPWEMFTTIVRRLRIMKGVDIAQRGGDNTMSSQLDVVWKIHNMKGFDQGEKTEVIFLGTTNSAYVSIGRTRLEQEGEKTGCKNLRPEREKRHEARKEMKTTIPLEVCCYQINFFVLLLLNVASACKRGKRRRETCWLWLWGYKPTKLLKFAEGTSIYVFFIFALENLGCFSNETQSSTTFPLSPLISSKVSTK